ncbi:hypothetical protein [Clostridium felsineum]|uniref:Uncharacterized protein n=1 Tax=Clostridium felsineum TaxID=36839 RepID=A0A1S8MDY3_9CLOT|nr:hypothetical protein [Clostridium felsineum]URZ06514.1 hypothetical protein CLROS_018470 [Clostridium felsineum]URZ11549.1 hypothetical protein CROST_022660 [Clostridium felsineum]
MKVTVIMPKDTTELESKYEQVLSDIIVDMLSHEELGNLIKRLEKKE